MTRKFKFTNARVRDLPVTSETRVYWDFDLPGFGLRKMANSGTATYILQRRTRKGRGIKLKLGRCAEVSTDHARQRARELIREIDAGADPAADLKAARVAERERKRAPTVALMIREWIDANAAGWRPSTVENYGRWTDLHVLPRLGARKAHEVEPGDVRRWYRELVAAGAGPATVNRALAVLSSAYSWARSSDEWPTIMSNPCLGAIGRRAKMAEHRRERYPTGDELERLVGVLRDRSDLPARFFLFCLLTGCRRSEAWSAKWSDIDLDAGTWTKPAGSTKQRKAHRLPLSPEAVAVLRALKPRLLFSPFGSLGESTLRKAWTEVVVAARIGDLRVHDLRHWHASLLASAGLSLPMIGALLGHSSPATTSRYAHLLDKALREATGQLGQVVDLAGRRS
jgi:integrase